MAYTDDLRSLAGEDPSLDSRSLAGGTSKYTKFNIALMDMLKRAQQGTNITQFNQAALAGVAAQAKEGYKPLASDVAGLQLNPSQIQQYRGAQQAPFGPAISGYAQMGKGLSEQLANFGSAIEQARYLGQVFQQEEESELARKDALRKEKQGIMFSNPTAYKTWFQALDPQTQKKEAESMGVSPEFVLSLPEEEPKKTEIVEANNRKYLIDSQTGEIIKDLGVAKAEGTGGGGLTPAQINSTVNSIAGAFDNEPIVKSYNMAAEGYQTLKTIGVDSTNPADDIAFIYSFAKIMDPNSVVREGEYNTVQKYAQSWAQAFGFKAQRIYSNTNFLSKDAKQKMLNVLETKLGTLETQYDNVYNEYQRQINDAMAGNPRTIQDYSKAFGKGVLDPMVDLEDDITQGLNDSKYKVDRGTEQLIKDLQAAYPEIDKSQIIDKVYQMRKSILGT